MKFLDKNIPRIHKCVALWYTELGEEGARKILAARAFDTALGKTTKAPPHLAPLSYAQGISSFGLTLLVTENKEFYLLLQCLLPRIRKFMVSNDLILKGLADLVFDNILWSHFRV